MSQHRRIQCNSFFTFSEALQEIDRLKFTFSALVEQFPNGSFQREIAQNALIGIRHRIDYLHDSLVDAHPKGTPT